MKPNEFKNYHVMPTHIFHILLSKWKPQIYTEDIIIFIRSGARLEEAMSKYMINIFKHVKNAKFETTVAGLARLLKSRLLQRTSCGNKNTNMQHETAGDRVACNNMQHTALHLHGKSYGVSRVLCFSSRCIIVECLMCIKIELGFY